MSRLFFIFSLFLAAVSWAAPADQAFGYSCELIDKAPYSRPHSCPEDIWAAMEPHFLPLGHPARQQLNAIFTKPGILATPKSMRKAGFISSHPRKYTQVIVTRHPRLGGFLIKTYLEDYDEREWVKWLQRIQGAQLVQADIDNFGFSPIVKVPKKWIYPIPPDAVSEEAPGVFPKHFILVVQDVGVISSEANKYHWKHRMTSELLTALYIIIRKNQMYDSVNIDNIPFCFDGKVAFVDTEQIFIPRDVKFWKLYEYLSSEMTDYLKGLVENGVS